MPTSTRSDGPTRPRCSIGCCRPGVGRRGGERSRGPWSPGRVYGRRFECPDGVADRDAAALDHVRSQPAEVLERVLDPGDGERFEVLAGWAVAHADAGRVADPEPLPDQLAEADAACDDVSAGV